MMMKNRSLFSICTTLAVSVMTASCTTLKTQNSCHNDQPQSYFGIYEVVDVVEYVEGVSDIDEMNQYLGKQVTISGDLFQYEDITLQLPLYRLECHQIDKTEGEVHPYRRSTHFYGFNWDERDEIKSLVIYEKSNEGDLLIKGRFEVMSTAELWEASSFWFLKFRVSS